MCQTFSASPVSQAFTSAPGSLLIGGRCRYLHRHAVLYVLHLSATVLQRLPLDPLKRKDSRRTPTFSDRRVPLRFLISYLHAVLSFMLFFPVPSKVQERLCPVMSDLAIAKALHAGNQH